MTSLAYRPELDGLRSVAVYLVVAFHARMVLLDGGFVGVDLFFVLSGFLVTGVLLRDVDVHGRLLVGTFYARRVRRLLPAAVVVVVATCLVQVLVATLPDRVDMVDEARASLLYYANWQLIAEGRDYFAADTSSSPFLHFWSLAIEEQFYIVYPLLLLLLLRFSRRPIRALWTVLVVVGLVSVALQVWTARDDVNLAYYGTHTRVYQLAAGAALMLLVRRMARGSGGRRRAAADPARWATPVALVGLVGVGLTASAAVDVTQSTRGLLAVVFSSLTLFGLWWSPSGALSRLLALPVPRYLGRVSYGTYLWHWPVVLVLREVFDARPLVLALLTAALATGLAALSFEVLESPIRRAPSLNRFRWSVVAAGLTASALLFAFVVPQVLELDRRPALAATGPTAPVGSLAADLDRRVPPDLDLVGARADVGPEERVCSQEDPDGCRFLTGSGQHVLVIGDSEARSLGTAFLRMAEARDLTLSMMFTPDCPWQVDQVVSRGSPEREARCREHREDFYRDVLPDLDVDVVVAAGLSRSQPFWETRVSSPSSPPGESLDELQARTTEKTADLVAEAGKELVIVKSIIGTNGFVWLGPDPVDCLATARVLADCAVVRPLGQPKVDSTYDALAVTRDDVATIDVNPLVCPSRSVCSPVVDGQPVWADDHHVTASYFAANSRRIWRLLTATGIVDPTPSR